jgi:hypothetical protein
MTLELTRRLVTCEINQEQGLNIFAGGLGKCLEGEYPIKFSSVKNYKRNKNKKLGEFLLFVVHIISFNAFNFLFGDE